MMDLRMLLQLRCDTPMPGQFLRLLSDNEELCRDLCPDNRHCEMQRRVFFLFSEMKPSMW